MQHNETHANRCPSELSQAEEYLGAPLSEYSQAKVEEFRKDNETRSPGGIVFCGDSITAGFPFEEILPAYNIANRGIGGDIIWGLIRRLDVSAFDLHPRQIFLMIGINDIFINKMTASEYGELYDYLLGELKQKCPGCRIYVQSLLPVRGSFAGLSSTELNQMVLAVNLEIKAVARNHGLVYIDLHPKFRDENGEMKEQYSKDGVHPNREGYEFWARLLIKRLKK